MTINKNSYFLFFLICYIVLSARSCEDQVVMENIEFSEQVNLIENGMLAQLPDNNSLAAFEEKAKQKVIYFSELLNIISNSKLDPSMRESARSNLFELFAEKNASVNFRYEKANVSIKDSLISFINSINRSEYASSYKLIDESLWIKKKLKIQNDSLYTGILSFDLSTAKGVSNSPDIPFVFSYEADFYLKKIHKNFGTTEKLIWQVFLGNIRTE